MERRPAPDCPPAPTPRPAPPSTARARPQPTDAWLMGYRGDIAFAMVLQGTGNGGPTDGPIVARFLNALGAGRRRR